MGAPKCRGFLIIEYKIPPSDTTSYMVEPQVCLLSLRAFKNVSARHPSQLRLVGVYTQLYLLSLTASALYFLNGGRCACPGLLQSGKRLRHLFRLLGIRFHHFSAHARVVSLRAANRLLHRGHQHNAKNPSAQPHCTKLKGSPNEQTARKDLTSTADGRQSSILKSARNFLLCCEAVRRYGGTLKFPGRSIIFELRRILLP